jgi:hypothetical protein
VVPATGAVTVEPGASVEVPFTLAPARTAAAGDYAGAIVVARGAERVSLPIRLRVGGALKPGMAVEDVHVGTSRVTYTVRNTGNATLAARSALKVSGPFGRFAAKPGAVADTRPLLPGETWRASAPVRDVAPAIRTTATVTLTPLLTDAAGSTAPLPAVTASGHAWTIPWTLPALILAAAVALWLRARRRAKGVPAGRAPSDAWVRTGAARRRREAGTPSGARSPRR